MSQVNSLFNAIVIAALGGAVLFFAISPREPKPLPSDGSFLSRVQRPGPVVVKFGATWCPPCRKIEEELDQLEISSGGQVSVVKIDVDQDQSLAMHYGVSSIPHLLLFRDGKQVAETKGYRSREQLEQWIASAR